MTLDLFNGTDLRRAVRHEGGVSRRLFLAYGPPSRPCPGWLTEPTPPLLGSGSA
jgi:hypothetical protein